MCIRDSLYVQSSLKQVKLFILIYNLLGQPVRIQRLTTQTEYCLSIYITALGDRTACRVSLGNEDAAFLLLVPFDIVQMKAAVT